MDNQKLIRSMSLIHFITNNNACYVKIKNKSTNKYICICDSNSTKKEPEIIGKNDGSILILRPSYINSKLYITFQSNSGELHIISKKNSSMLHALNSRGETISGSQYYLDGILDGIYIRSCHDNVNMFGETGRYLYMSDDGYVHCDGDKSIMSSLWEIEKINTLKTVCEMRTDYNTEYSSMIKESQKNVTKLFPDIIKYFTLQNIGCGKYLNISFNSEDSYENKLIGSFDKSKFVIRQNLKENCVYISYYLNNLELNIYTIPKSTDVYIGAPECEWAKFYVIKRGGYYMFQCFHRESDVNGNYGRYLCMRKNEKSLDSAYDVYDVFADGCENDNTSKWDIKTMNT